MPEACLPIQMMELRLRHRDMRTAQMCDHGVKLDWETRISCLADSARVTLGPGVVYRDGRLVDSVSGDAYPLNPTGRLVAQVLLQPATIASAARALDEEFGVGSARALADVKDFITEVNRLGFASVVQPFALEAQAWVRQWWRNVWLLPSARRAARWVPPRRLYPATPVTILLACCEAHQPTVICGLAIGVGSALALILLRLLRGGGLPSPLDGLILPSALVAVSCVVAIVMSAVVHELGHYGAARLLGLRVKNVSVRMCCVGVTHASSSRAGTWCVSVFGPILAMVVLCVGALIVVRSSIGQIGLAISTFLFGLAALHGLSLAPFWSDGRQAMAGLSIFMRSRRERLWARPPSDPGIRDGEPETRRAGFPGLEISELVVCNGSFSLGPMNVALRRAEVASLLGHNGSGKTTLIRSILGLHTLDSGEITWDGAKLAGRPSRVFARIGVVSDSADDILPELTAGEFWEFCAMAYSRHENDAGQSIDLMLERAFELASRMDLQSSNRRIGSLSLGTRRKVQLVASMLNSPDLLVLDEPLIGLDLTSTRALAAIIADERRRGALVLMASHDVLLAERLADRVLVLQAGRLVLDFSVTGSGSLEGRIQDVIKAPPPASAP